MAVKFFRFDFGKLAAVDGSLGMIWLLDKAWTPVGGSAALAKEVVTDEGSVELTEGEARAFPFHVDAYPAFVRKFQHWSGVNRSQISPMAAKRSVTVLAPTFRRWAFSFEKAISMGFKSGL